MDALSDERKQVKDFMIVERSDSFMVSHRETSQSSMYHDQLVLSLRHYRRSLQNDFTNKTEGSVGKEPAKILCFHKNRPYRIAGR